LCLSDHVTVQCLPNRAAVPNLLVDPYLPEVGTLSGWTTWFTLSLGQYLVMHAAHERRHLRQARQVKDAIGSRASRAPLA